jgi:NAD(P)-dependent dehydrogenase (short-subunit alcohol dehydrogenase family)
MRWLITGISRGLGRELAAAALAAGHDVAGTTRDGTTDLAGVTAVALDVTDVRQVESAVGECIRSLGGLDVVVNNAGHGFVGAVEETTDDDARQVIETNLLGPLRVIRVALPVLRTQRSGRIVSISSLAALAPLAGSGVYAAAKAGLLAMSGALACELEPFGVGVTTVALGSFRTGFLSAGSMRRASLTIDAYATTTAEIAARVVRNDGKQAGDPRRAAELIVGAVSGDNPPELLAVGADAVDRSLARIARQRQEIDLWASRSRTTAVCDQEA